MNYMGMVFNSPRYIKDYVYRGTQEYGPSPREEIQEFAQQISKVYQINHVVQGPWACEERRQIASLITRATEDSWSLTESRR